MRGEHVSAREARRSAATQCLQVEVIGKMFAKRTFTEDCKTEGDSVFTGFFSLLQALQQAAVSNDPHSAEVLPS